MLELVEVGSRSLRTYRDVAPDPVLDALTQAGRELQGARVLHVNATPYGGGVSELLDANRRVVLGSVLPVNVPQYLRLALEYRRDMPQGGLPKTNNVIGEIWLNF